MVDSFVVFQRHLVDLPDAPSSSIRFNVHPCRWGTCDGLIPEVSTYQRTPPDPSLHNMTSRADSMAT